MLHAHDPCVFHVSPCACCRFQSHVCFACCSQPLGSIAIGPSHVQALPLATSSHGSPEQDAQEHHHQHQEDHEGHQAHEGNESHEGHKAMKAIKARKATKAKAMKAAKPELPMVPQPPLWFMAIHCLAPQCQSWVWVTRLSNHGACAVCAKPWAESISNIRLHL